MGLCCARQRNRDPNAEVWVAKEDVTLWNFKKGSEPEKWKCTKGDEFIVKKKSRQTDYADKTFYWLFQKDQALGQTGWACRFYFHQLHYTIPEDTYMWFFGSLERRDADELLQHKQNGDGAYLVRWSKKKKSFVLSIKYMSEAHADWATTHYNVMRTDQENNRGQFYFEPNLMFHQMEDLLTKYKEEGQRRFPTHLTNICFVPNPLVDPRFAKDIEMDAEDNPWLINRDEVTIHKELGRGNFGVVSLGKWKETEVAIKELISIDNAKNYSGTGAGAYDKDEKYEKEKKNFEKEMEIMKLLHHPNLVKMYGIVTDKFPFYIVTELCSKGDLKKHLESFKQGTGELIKGKRKVPTFIQLLQWCKEISGGMSYLEKQHIVHRDLAARNVLLDRNSVAKVADFGLSKAETSETDNEAFPILWSPLEVLTKRQFSIKSDVWSFGITMWEIFSFGEKPYNGMKHNDLKNFLKNKKRIDPPRVYLKEDNADKNISRVFKEIMMKCWEGQPADRPSFAEVGSMLQEELKAKAQDNLYH